MGKKVHTSKLDRDLTVKIPPDFALELGLGPDSSVDVSLLGNAIVVCPTRQPALILDDLLSNVTEENRHGETDTGPAIGREVL